MFEMPRRLRCVALVLLAACGGNTHTPTATAPVAPGTIVGAITSTQGGALSGVRVVVTPGGGTPLGAVTTSSNGNFAATGVPVATDDGTVTLSSLPANCATPPSIAYAGLTGGDTVIVNVTVTCTTPAGPPGSVTGTVTSNSGAGLAGVMVIVTPNGGAAMSPVSTNSTGVYTVTNVPAGSGTVGVSGLPGFCATPTSVPYTGLTNTMSVTTDIVVQCVVPTGTVTGTVTSSLGGGLAGVGVIVTPTGGTPLPAVMTTTSGAYTMHGVPIGAGTVSLIGVPATCATPMPMPYTGLVFNGTVTVNAPVACTPPASLTVTVTTVVGTASITVTGPGGYLHSVTSTTTLTGLAAGTYTVSAPTSEQPDPIVPTIYTATVTGSPATVSAGGSANVTVAYAQVGGTGGLWVGTTGPSVVGELTPNQLRAGGFQSLSPAGGSNAALRFVAAAFDAQGTLWLTEQESSEIFGYTAAQLASGSGSLSLPAFTISVPGMTGLEGLAFDPTGNLWIAASNELVALTPTQLSASGSVATPKTISTSVLPTFRRDRFRCGRHPVGGLHTGAELLVWPLRLHVRAAGHGRVDRASRHRFVQQRHAGAGADGVGIRCGGRALGGAARGVRGVHSRTAAESSDLRQISWSPAAR